LKAARQPRSVRRKKLFQVWAEQWVSLAIGIRACTNLEPLFSRQAGWVSSNQCQQKGQSLCRAGFLACTNRGAEQTFSDAQSKLSLKQGVGIQQRPNDTLQDQLRWSHSVGSACARHEEYDVNCSKARNNTCATLLLYFAPLRVAPCAALHCSASA
jgi:hypothetical protein